MTDGTGIVTGVRVSHDRVPVETVERVRLDDEATAVSRLLDEPMVTEAYVLQTCHRVEAYVVSPADAAGRAALSALDLSADGVYLDHGESLRHLLRLAAGLESLVLGEDQILGQVRDAYETARGAGGVGPVLEGAVTKAIHVGERARTETKINEGVVSMSGAAVRLAASVADLDGATALVVGAGEMGRLAAKAFATTDVERVVVANRTPDRARDVAAALPVEASATGLDALDEQVRAASVVVAATASDDPVLDAGTLADAGETVVVDLGQPRDLAPEAVDLDPVTAYDLDDLEAVTDATHGQRREAAETVSALVDREYERLIDQQKRRRADEVIGTMYESAERLKQREVSTALARLESVGGVSEGQREVVESLADALVSQLLATPTKSLREAAGEDDWRTIHTALELFDPELEGELPFGVGDDGAIPETAGTTESAETAEAIEDAGKPDSSDEAVAEYEDD